MVKFKNTLFEGSFNSKKLYALNTRVLNILEKRSPLDEYMKNISEELIAESHNYINGRFGYKIIDQYKINVNKDHIKLSPEIIFNTSNIISAQLKGSEGIIVFASTLGIEYDRWLKYLFGSNEPLKGYIADLIGSVAVECAADQLEELINKDLSAHRLNCSNRYSPGYCSWNVSEQKKLFSLLPGNFCGIELTPSSLMIPIKSVSGIIGYGRNVEKKDYACKICTQENCYLNKLNA